ncbi:MAG: TraB/GumN family protein [Sphingomonadaceae bacterium]|nr:TraB/GumN family protein [Sphingomonadaceae bacterium]
MRHIIFLPLRAALAALALCLLPLSPAKAQQATSTAPAASTAPSTNDQARDADPALWVVRDDDSIIYLFGTVHMLPAGLSWFDEAIADAFNNADTLVLELPAGANDDAASRMNAQSTATDGRTMQSRMDGAQYATYRRAMESVHMPVAAFENREPWLPAILLNILPLVQQGYDPAQGAEAVLTHAAQAAHKPILGLETADEQLALFDEMPMDEQVAVLLSSAEQATGNGPQMPQMLADWSAGNPDALAAAMNQGLEDHPALRARLLTNRNTRWTDWIKTRLDNGSGATFIAVGAGHLAGEDSVIAMLRARGLSVERIAY